MAKHHHYACITEWTGNTGQGTASYTGYTRDHVVRIAGKPELAGSSDRSFRGDAARHNPEDLLLASLSACHMLWFLHLASEAGVVVERYVDNAEAMMVMEPDGAGQFVEVILHPDVAISAGEAATTDDLHTKAHAKCFIARSMNFPVRHQPSTHVLGT